MAYYDFDFTKINDDDLETVFKCKTVVQAKANISNGTVSANEMLIMNYIIQM